MWKSPGTILILAAPLVPVFAALAALAASRVGLDEGAAGMGGVLPISVALLAVLSGLATLSLRKERAASGAAGDVRNESEARLAEAVGVNEFGVVDHDPTDGSTVFSARLEAMLGVAPGHLDAATWHRSLLDQDHAPSAGDVRRRALHGLADGPQDVRVTRSDGEVRDLHGMGRHIRDDAGQVRRVSVIFQDVTDQNRDRDARASLARALDLSACMVRTFDGVIEYWPRGCEALYGWTAGEAVGQRAQDLLKIRFPQPLDEVLTTLRREGEWTGELYKQDRSGGVHCIAAHWVLDDRGPDLEPRIVESVSDISDLKQAHAALRETQDRLVEAVTTFGLGIVDFNPRSRTASFSEQMERIAGVDRGALDGDIERWMSLTATEGRAEVLDQAAADVAAQAERTEHDLRLVRPDGQVRRLRGVRRYIYDDAGRCSRMISIYMDVTDQEDAADALRESETRLAQAVAAYELGIFEIDMRTGAAKISDELAKITGYQDQTVDRGAFRKVVLAEDLDRLDHDRREVVRLRQERNPQHFRIIRADGELRHLDGVTNYSYGPSGEISRAIGIYKDVTDQVIDRTELKARATRLQALQAELTQVSRLSAMGEMAATLAHELNQPLTAVGAAVGAIGMLMASDSPIQGELRERVRGAAVQAETQAVRAGEIVRRLREFITRGEADAKVEDLEDLMDDSLALALPGRAAASVEVRTWGPPSGVRVLADRVQIQQILVNLIRNAVEAMAPQTTPKILTLTSEVEDETAVIRVSDSGPGIAPEVADRLFTPFTSSKRDGMGVGLSICRRIAETHNGTLSLEHTDRHGATFRLTLPMHTEGS